jgi:hypothetical protein
VISVEQTNIVKQKAETPCLSMRPRECALALGISERLLAEWTRRHLVPHVKIGGVILYPADSLRDWLRKQAETDEKKSEEGT